MIFAQLIKTSVTARRTRMYDVPRVCQLWRTLGCDETWIKYWNLSAENVLTWDYGKTVGKTGNGWRDGDFKVQPKKTRKSKK